MGQPPGHSLPDVGLVRCQLHGGVRDEAAATLGIRQGKFHHAFDELAYEREGRARLAEERNSGPYATFRAVEVHGLEEQFAFVAEGGVERTAIDIHRGEEVFHGSRFIALAPEDMHGLVERFSGIELFGACHGGSIANYGMISQ